METATIAAYWDKQSTIWREEKEEAWTKPETEYWLQFFQSLRSDLKGNKALEIGTASGYFANIMHLAGFEVTAVDVSPLMIAEAEKVSAELGFPIQYQVMDAQHLDLQADQYDLIFTRLMTWTIPDLKQFYQEAYRVLAPNGVFLNIDGDFGKCRFSQEGHEKYPSEIMEEANTIKEQLAVNSYDRPKKDAELLCEVGFAPVIIDNTAPATILHQDEGTSDMFLLTGVKSI